MGGDSFSKLSGNLQTHKSIRRLPASVSLIDPQSSTSTWTRFQSEPILTLKWPLFPSRWVSAQVWKDGNNGYRKTSTRTEYTPTHAQNMPRRAHKTHQHISASTHSFSSSFSLLWTWAALLALYRNLSMKTCKTNSSGVSTDQPQRLASTTLHHQPSHSGSVSVSQTQTGQKASSVTPRTKLSNTTAHRPCPLLTLNSWWDTGVFVVPVCVACTAAGPRTLYAGSSVGLPWFSQSFRSRHGNCRASGSAGGWCRLPRRSRSFCRGRRPRWWTATSEGGGDYSAGVSSRLIMPIVSNGER